MVLSVLLEGGGYWGSSPPLFSKASVVGASYKRRYTSNSHANGEGDLEKRGEKGEMCY